jgi:hypothetical protein
MCPEQLAFCFSKHIKSIFKLSNNNVSSYTSFGNITRLTKERCGSAATAAQVWGYFRLLTGADKNTRTTEFSR